MSPRIAFACVLLACAPAVLAQVPQPLAAALTATAPGVGVAERLAEITASVAAVDPELRTVTLKDADGNLLTLPVGAEVQNFERIAVGDRVAVRYFEALMLELRKHGSAPLERTDRVVAETAGPGERPATRGAHEVHAIANVVALDPATQTVTLRGPTRVVNLRVRDPAQFALVETGDQVEVTYIEAAAVSVEPAPNP